MTKHDRPPLHTVILAIDTVVAMVAIAALANKLMRLLAKRKPAARRGTAMEE